MFGESLVGSTGEDSQSEDLTAKLRLRIVQANRELDVCHQQLELCSEERIQLGKLVEQKDERLAQLYAEVDRVRKVSVYLKLNPSNLYIFLACLRRCRLSYS